MDLMEWLLEKRPGVVTRLDDRIRIAHERGGNSSLWLNKGVAGPICNGELEEFYRLYDGADLFGSTFKIASIEESKRIGNVNITFALGKIQAECDGLGVSFPSDTFPFMYQAGIAFYAASNTSDLIHSWDTETGCRESYGSLFAIIQEWIDAMDETNEP